MATRPALSTSLASLAGELDPTNRAENADRDLPANVSQGVWDGAETSQDRRQWPLYCRLEPQDWSRSLRPDDRRGAKAIPRGFCPLPTWQTGSAAAAG